MSAIIAARSDGHQSDGRAAAARGSGSLPKLKPGASAPSATSTLSTYCFGLHNVPVDATVVAQKIFNDSLAWSWAMVQSEKDVSSCGLIQEITEDKVSAKEQEIKQ